MRDVNQRAEMVKLIVDVALASLGLPIHVLDPRLKKYESLLVEAGKQNPSSGGCHTGGRPFNHARCVGLDCSHFIQLRESYASAA